MAKDAFQASARADAFCRSAVPSRPWQERVHVRPYPPQRLPGFESGRIEKVVVGEIACWRWWKVIDGGLFTLNGSRPVPAGPFEVDFLERGGMAAFKRREDAERMFAALSAKWTPYPRAITFQSELPAAAPRVAPDAYCLGSVELWGAVHEYECGYLGQFVCVTSIDRIIGPMSEAATLASLHKSYFGASRR
jgi:hypothetical protein